MPGPDTDVQQVKKILPLQRSEITEHHIYTKIAAATPEPGNRDVLTRIAAQELEHYGIWKRYTGQEVAPDRKRIWFYYLVARIFGMTFAIKLMEGMEQRAQSVDQSSLDLIPEMPQMLANEKAHERDLIALIDEERLKYIGSVVLGLNDALIEFTGTLAGLTFALQNTRIIAVAGLITGVAASLSMGASEYMSQRSDEPADRPAEGIALHGSHVYPDGRAAHPAVPPYPQPVCCSPVHPARGSCCYFPVHVLHFSGKEPPVLAAVL